MSPSLKLLFLCFFVGIVYAMEKPCCISKKWFGKLKITTVLLKNGSTIPTVSDNRLMMDYDMDMKMERIYGTIHSDGPMGMTASNYTVYNDFMNGKRYILNDMGNYCNISMIPPETEMDSHCVPSTLQWDAMYTYGSGPEALHVNSWEGMYNNFYYSMQTSVNDCTPVSMTRTGMNPDGERIVETVLYVDIVQYRVSDDESVVFKIPDSCMMTYFIELRMRDDVLLLVLKEY
ncbi:uncharacterized protein LOC123530177 [Mercenaria mercenaria]|uniref:uncharacterized protein LOC123530177 n=1 Tax=Mercenaria mercenaria TaxID=6596 RepID=UPI00234E455C|nr:uncharacterized protein LOC123530177 [Mercenaria mercenaria]